MCVYLLISFPLFFLDVCICFNTFPLFGVIRFGCNAPLSLPPQPTYCLQSGGLHASKNSSCHRYLYRTVYVVGSVPFFTVNVVGSVLFILLMLWGLFFFYCLCSGSCSFFTVIVTVSCLFFSIHTLVLCLIRSFF